MKDLKELTKAEDQVMQILWKLEKAFVKDIVEEMPNPKPAYNTVSTIVRILETKGFVNHKAYGKTHEYFPTITKEKYTKFFFEHFHARADTRLSNPKRIGRVTEIQMLSDSECLYK